MKRAFLAMMVAFSIVLSGCYGSFALTQRMYHWNGNVDGKYVNSLLLWVLGIAQVYTVTLVLDAAILNVIEFWSGKNPVPFRSVRRSEKIVVSGDKIYRVTLGGDEIAVDRLSGPDVGRGVTIRFDDATSSFYLSDRRNPPVRIASMDTAARRTANFYLPNGKVLTRPLYGTVSLSAFSD